MKRLSGFLIYLALVGCRASTNDATYAQLNNQSRTAMRQVVETKSSLNRDDKLMFSWTVTRLPLRQKLLVAFFSDESHGWVASREGSLFKTADSGEAWTKAPINIPPGAYVRSIYFVSPDVGWIAVENPTTDILEYRNNQAWVLHTQDGGRTWKEQYADKALAIYKVLFINEREGWASGARYSQKQTLMTERFVLHTTDQGGHWIDVSGNLNQSIHAEEGSNTHVQDVGISKSPKAIFFNATGQIISTSDGGQHWDLVSALITEHLGMGRMGVLENGNLWLLGGTNGKHGTFSALGVFDGKGLWVKYIISGVRLDDAVFLSEDKVFACGLMQVGEDRTAMKSDGVILHSSDKGLNWSIVYRNHLTNSINSLFVTNSNHVWAVANEGLILKAKL